jgi:hypothetical protein
MKHFYRDTSNSEKCAIYLRLYEATWVTTWKWNPNRQRQWKSKNVFGSKKQNQQNGHKFVNIKWNYIEMIQNWMKNKFTYNIQMIIETLKFVVIFYAPTLTTVK